MDRSGAEAKIRKRVRMHFRHFSEVSWEARWIAVSRKAMKTTVSTELRD